MHPLPILFLGDGPTLHTGLARIGRHLAANLSRDPRFRVGYLGRGGQVSRHLPFQQYVFQPTAEDQWGAGSLAGVVKDFRGNDDGPMVLFTVWDPSRVSYIGARQYSRGEDDELDAVLFDPQMRFWGYFPIDGAGIGPDGALTGFLRMVISGYHRVLGYTERGMDILRASMQSAGDPDGPRPVALSDLAHLPHGINLSTFYPRDKRVARASLSIPNDAYVVGCVMTNQPRKDWGLWAQAASHARANVENLYGKGNFRLLAKIDDWTRHWDLRALCEDLNLGDITTVVVEDLPDEKMAWFYSACDLTILPSLGEGFGYPIVESLACGVPVLAGSYFPGAAEIPPLTDVVPVVGHYDLRLDTRWNTLRPLYYAKSWAVWISHCAKGKVKLLPDEVVAKQYIDSIQQFHWPTLWPKWLRWFEAGLEGSE